MQMFSYSLKIEQISLGKFICQFMLLLAIIWTLARTYLQFLFTYKMEKILLYNILMLRFVVI